MNRRERFILIILIASIAVLSLVIVIYGVVFSGKKSVLREHEEQPLTEPFSPETPGAAEEPSDGGQKDATAEETIIRLQGGGEAAGGTPAGGAAAGGAPLVSYQVSRPLSSLSVRRLSGLGVNVSEIDPINYENPDLDVLKQMGAEQYLISFFAGEQFYKSGDFDKAITEYTASINRNSGFIEAYISRGKTYTKKRDHIRAIDDYTRAVRLDGNRAELYNYRGFARSERGEMNIAIEDFSRAVSLNRNYIDALVNRSHAYYQTGDYEKTIADCDRIIALEPSNYVIWNRRGSAWYRREDDDRAIRDFSEAIRLNSNYAIAWYNRGNAWYNKGDTDKALTDINRCLTLNPSYSAANTLREKIISGGKQPRRLPP